MHKDLINVLQDIIFNHHPEEKNDMHIFFIYLTQSVAALHLLRNPPCRLKTPVHLKPCFSTHISNLFHETLLLQFISNQYALLYIH